MNSAERITRAPWRQAIAGAILLGAGITILSVSWSYPTGGIVQMGPGYLPKTVGLGLMGMAILVIISDMRDVEQGRGSPVHWRALIFISASILAFSMLVTRAGLVPATFAALVLAMLADNRSRPTGILVYAAVMTGLTWLLFIPLLGLPLSAFWR